MAESTEQRELDLVDKVDFRILEVANNEEKLEQLLSRYLAPLMLKAGSPHASVRAKVIAVLKRVMTFVQPPGYVLFFIRPREGVSHARKKGMNGWKE